MPTPRRLPFPASVLPEGALRPLALLAGFLCTLALSACDKSKGPHWERSGGGKPVAALPAAPVATAGQPVPEARAAAAVPGERAGLRFVAYNVKNWLNMDRYVDRQSLKNATKPEKEKEAVLTILARQEPDAIGLCEIGSAEDLAEIQERLKAKGVDLPHLHYIGGSDPVRHLGFLSRYPITATGKAGKMEYQLQGKMFGWNRGVLDVTVQANGKPYRFLGVHLKSKREVEEADEEEMRRSEARLLRRHVDSIFSTNPDERLIVYGDFNDTRGSVSVKNMLGSYNDPKYLTALVARDTVGTTWTHFWALNDIYSRIDFIAVSKAMKPDTDFKSARILDDPEWETASDHRAVLAVFK